MNYTVNGFTRRTLRDALIHLVEGIEADALSKPGGCKYIGDDGKPCVIGSLFTREQRQFIKDLPYVNGINPPNRSRIGTLAESQFLGRENVEFMTGMAVGQATAIQCRWDTGRSQDPEAVRAQLLDDLKAVLENGAGNIGGTAFVLDREPLGTPLA